LSSVTVDELIARDGPRCVWCGHDAWRSDLTVEHLLPRVRGGQGLPENLAVACRRCNRRRGTKPVVAYVRELLDAGEAPLLAGVSAALARLGESSSAAHADYGRRQAALLERLEA
jgi:5-methylcytosine-specific restriction endonuclease McrA